MENEEGGKPQLIVGNVYLWHSTIEVQLLEIDRQYVTVKCLNGGNVYKVENREIKIFTKEYYLKHRNMLSQQLDRLSYAAQLAGVV